MSTAKQEIKQEVLDLLKNNSKARYRLCYEFNAHMNAINRWIDSNDIKLTTPMGLNAISEELEIKKSEILKTA